ncbi:TonB-dependent receptor [Altererythrobacter xixiisoli]|uniref:TonB-dependent receptor n=1 Tax=Croceibacterium xixiisoli TaxID=1476466 RepID=A0A6I4U0L6_9SPHN|nr:TonB-dependent receptor [Croceibacterium xixiisoli]MXP00409.1 TonB-dependent receptor [Croceibacterium xixiisoli]
MTTGKQLGGLLLLTTALSFPGVALAQDTAANSGQQNPVSADQPVEEPVAQETDISVPGGTIVVTGRINRDPTRNSSQVLNVLSSEQIARTGEGNIAGALGRVTGLSVVGSGFVYVRGLGDRYSLALLNGSPLPSPEPLRRVVPLDLFPTGLVASSLVQKTYSANYPGEFGGGVINLTTKAIPDEPFLTVGVGGSWDSETTNQTGYSYFGSSSDWTGFDNGNRDIPPALADFFASGERISGGNVDTQAIAGQFVTGRNAVVQRFSNMPANWSGSFSGGTAIQLGASELGVIVGGGYSNKYTTRDAIQQGSFSADLSAVDSDYRRVSTDQRIVVNGMLGLGLKFGENTIRWTNLYIRDTVKHTRLGLGQEMQGIADFMQQDTAWYARQLIDTQFVGEFHPMDGLSIDVRGGYANSKRDAPFELSFEYVRTNTPADPYGDHFVNRLNRNAGSADVTFSELNEDLWSGGVDVSYEVLPRVVATIGGAIADTTRTSSRRSFLFDAPTSFESGVGMLRPDLLLQPGIIDYYNIGLIEDDESSPAFRAKLENYAGYGKINAELVEGIVLDAGVRYETAKQTVSPIQVFNTPSGSTAATQLDNNYWLPGATLTWEARPDLQFRISGSKTIARPQFRELIYQPYFDPESNRTYLGNPLLQDSQLFNAEARAEWYINRDEKISLAGFFKKIDNPIEAFIVSLSGIQTVSYANAPSASLYGAEFEVQQMFDLPNGLWEQGQRIMLVGNYTFTKSQLEVSSGDTVRVFGASSGIATDYFRDGASLTGQSDHLVNLQFGLENADRLSQQTFLLNYASDRVVTRGLNGSPPQPDVIERPGLTLDFVAREGFSVFGKNVEAKVEVRNIFGRRHEEFQQFEANRIDVNTYNVGTTFSGSLSVTF